MVTNVLYTLSDEKPLSDHSTMTPSHAAVPPIPRPLLQTLQEIWQGSIGMLPMGRLSCATLVHLTQSTRNSNHPSHAELIDAAPVILPGVIDGDGKDVTTFLVHWNGLWASHARFRHYDGNMFNITLFNSVVSLLHFSPLHPS